MTLLKGHFALLSWKDSNPRKRNQNPMCYHYTTGQFLIATAKVLLFLLPPRKISTFFQIFSHRSTKSHGSHLVTADFSTFSGLICFVRDIRLYFYLRLGTRFETPMAPVGHTRRHKWQPTHLLPMRWGLRSSPKVMAWWPPSMQEM